MNKVKDKKVSIPDFLNSSVIFTITTVILSQPVPSPFVSGAEIIVQISE